MCSYTFILQTCFQCLGYLILTESSNQQLQIPESLYTWNINEKMNSLKLFNILEVVQLWWILWVGYCYDRRNSTKTLVWMDGAKAHVGTTRAITKPQEAALKMSELPCCFGDGKKMAGFGGGTRNSWDGSHLKAAIGIGLGSTPSARSCSLAEWKDSSETSGEKPQGGSNANEQMWMHRPAGWLLIEVQSHRESPKTQNSLSVWREKPQTRWKCLWASLSEFLWEYGFWLRQQPWS